MFPCTQGVFGTFLRRRYDDDSEVQHKLHSPRPPGYRMPDGSHEALDCFQFVSLADLNPSPDVIHHHRSRLDTLQWVSGLNLEVGWAGHERELNELETCLGLFGTGGTFLEPEPNGIQVSIKEAHQK
ncbi:hypothetical protein N7489_000439 [Penicillium chrysogenum]|uniref:uncharacterized protein n=1 Tax=Penicillium chrysogenum TaxID=5076 RepID=UPI0024DF16EB|nr:uncharacterized protein N7489_000439 [Penicillium chrysogenum]KAJ5250029.1 hypothetical protein N7489_000439 [Penicillium chrysogenum]